MASVAKRKHDQIGETINSVSTEFDGRHGIPRCRSFMRNGECDYGDKCRFIHDKVADHSHAKSSVTRVKGKGKGNFKGKGSGRFGKGGKDATKSDVPTYYDRDIDNFCSRCNRDHKGGIGTDCAMSPCRFCVSEGHEDSGHHLRYCELKPDYWQLSSTLPNAAASKRPLAVREKPVSDKRQRMTALELVTSLSETELTAVCAAINTIHNEPEVSVATSADVEQEAIQVLTKLHRTSPAAKSAGSTLKCGDTTHLVPVNAAGVKAAATIGSVTRLGTSLADQRELQLKIARAKVIESRGPGYRNNGILSVSLNEAPKSPPLFDTYKLVR
jgi:hypothetical protein